MGAMRSAAVMGTGVAVAAGLLVSPAILAQPNQAMVRAAAPSPAMRAGFGSFTPASADPRIAAAIARSAMPSVAGFRFTPTDNVGTAKRMPGVSARTGAERGGITVERRAAVTPAAPAMPSIAYNLGAGTPATKRFALSADLARLDIANATSGRETYGVRRPTARAAAVAERPLAEQPRMGTDIPARVPDVAGSYSLTRNLDVTAGVRYRSEKDRLARLEGDRRENQALYVGTAFRF